MAQASQIEHVPIERFQAFHRSFNGEGAGIWDICAQCGGKCEIHKIGSIMPGEKEYMAGELGISISELQDKYLDLLITPRGATDVLKLSPGCPFLDSCYHCTAADKMAKPVLCEVYPVVFEVEVTEKAAQDLRLDVHFEVDEVDCPLMHFTYAWGNRKVTNPRWESYKQYFEDHAIEELRKVGAPAEWYWIVEQYDAANFDYHALKRMRRVPENQYGSITLDELMACQVTPGF